MSDWSLPEQAPEPAVTVLDYLRRDSGEFVVVELANNAQNRSEGVLEVPPGDTEVVLVTNPRNDTVDRVVVASIVRWHQANRARRERAGR